MANPTLKRAEIIQGIQAILKDFAARKTKNELTPNAELQYKAVFLYLYAELAKNNSDNVNDIQFANKIAMGLDAPERDLFIQWRATSSALVVAPELVTSAALSNVITSAKIGMPPNVINAIFESNAVSEYHQNKPVPLTPEQRQAITESIAQIQLQIAALSPDSFINQCCQFLGIDLTEKNAIAQGKSKELGRAVKALQTLEQTGDSAAMSTVLSGWKNNKTLQEQRGKFFTSDVTKSQEVINKAAERLSSAAPKPK